MKEIMLYRGCTTPVRLPAYEAATIAVLGKLGVKVVEMDDANCCGAQYVESVNRMAFAAMSGRCHSQDPGRRAARVRARLPPGRV